MSTLPEPDAPQALPLALAGRWYVALPSPCLGAEPAQAVVAGLALTLQRSADGQVACHPPRPCVEQDGYVWVCPGPGEPLAPPPALAAARRPGQAVTMRTVRVPASHRLVLENSLDFSHGPAVHPWTQPSWLLARLGLRGPLVVTYGPRPDGLALEGRLGGRLAYVHRFALPDRLELTLLPGTRMALEVVVMHVPETPRATRMEVLLARPALPWERREPRFMPGSLAVHRQDLAILAHQQQALDSGLVLPEHHAEADAFTLLLRQVLTAAEAGRPLPEGPDRTIRIRVA